MSDAELKLECIKIADRLSGGTDILQSAKDLYAFVAGNP